MHSAAAPASPHVVAPTAGSADICFRWDGPLDKAFAWLGEQGVAIVEGPVPRPAVDGSLGQSIYFRDPDDNLLEFLSSTSSSSTTSTTTTTTTTTTTAANVGGDS